MTDSKLTRDDLSTALTDLFGEVAPKPRTRRRQGAKDPLVPVVVVTDIDFGQHCSRDRTNRNLGWGRSTITVMDTWKTRHHAGFWGYYRPPLASGGLSRQCHRFHFYISEEAQRAWPRDPATGAWIVSEADWNRLEAFARKALAAGKSGGEMT